MPYVEARTTSLCNGKNERLSNNEQVTGPSSLLQIEAEVKPSTGRELHSVSQQLAEAAATTCDSDRAVGNH
jgi:hypothetical protein